jgi:hypothetical protein
LGKSDRGHNMGRVLPFVFHWREQATGWLRDLWGSGPAVEKCVVSRHDINLETSFTLMYFIAPQQHKLFNSLSMK